MTSGKSTTNASPYQPSPNHSQQPLAPLPSLYIISSSISDLHQPRAKPLRGPSIAVAENNKNHEHASQYDLRRSLHVVFTFVSAHICQGETYDNEEGGDFMGLGRTPG